MNNPTDTNQASELFELCRSVYERTGWEAPGTLWSEGTGALGSDEMCPLYTSDYLLEKLPSTIKNEFDGDDDYLILYKKSGSWYADYMGQFLRCKDDTPLKSLLKLTIALSEAGELK